MSARPRHRAQPMTLKELEAELREIVRLNEELRREHVALLERERPLFEEVESRHA